MHKAEFIPNLNPNLYMKINENDLRVLLPIVGFKIANDEVGILTIKESDMKNIVILNDGYETNEKEKPSMDSGVEPIRGRV